MAEDKNIIGDINNDYKSSNLEFVDNYRILTSKGIEELSIIRVFRDNDIKTLRYHGREILKVVYTDTENKTIRQAFYRSTGRHLAHENYNESKEYAIPTVGTWVPTDGVGYFDEGGVVIMKSDLNKDPYQDKYEKWKYRTSMIYKCDYFGKEIALEFGDETKKSVGLSIYNADVPKENKNFELARYGNLTTLRISYLLSSGDKVLPPFWRGPVGETIIEKHKFKINKSDRIRIKSNFVDAEDREVNNFIADSVSFNYQNGAAGYGNNYFRDRRKNRPYDLRYSYMPTAKGTWVMFYPYLCTNPDSRLDFNEQKLESKKIKNIYDIFDSDTFDINSLKKNPYEILKQKQIDEDRKEEEEKEEEEEEEEDIYDYSVYINEYNDYINDEDNEKYNDFTEENEYYLDDIRDDIYEESYFDFNIDSDIESE